MIYVPWKVTDYTRVTQPTYKTLVINCGRRTLRLLFLTTVLFVRSSLRVKESMGHQTDSSRIPKYCLVLCLVLLTLRECLKWLFGKLLRLFFHLLGRSEGLCTKVHYSL